MPHHRRIVLGIHHAATTGSLMKHAAEMARLMGLEMLGVFVEDEAVLDTASFPFVREFRLHSHEWHPMDPSNVETEFRHAASTAKRMLDSATKAQGVPCEFQVRRGNPSNVVAELLCPTDIVVLAQPKLGPSELTQSFLRAWRTACGSAASVLLLPPEPVRSRGVVVAIAGGERAVRTATHIAEIANETLLLLAPPDALESVTIQLPEDRVRRRALSDISEIALRAALGHGGDRLLVLDRDELSPEREAMVLRLAAKRGIPVLLVGPEDLL